MRYLENVTDSLFPPHSLRYFLCDPTLILRRVVYGSGGKDRMIIDTKTALNLEIISNALRC
jgi:hypothetical protein